MTKGKKMTTEIKPCPFCGGEAEIIQCKVIEFIKEKGWWIFGETYKNVEREGFSLRCKKYCRIPSPGTRSEAIAMWNRRTPDHIPDARKMIDPLISIVTWTRYDGSPETLPEEERPVCFSGVKERVAILFEGVWVDYFDDFISHPTPGDMWAYLPKPEEAEE